MIYSERRVLPRMTRSVPAANPRRRYDGFGYSPAGGDFAHSGFRGYETDDIAAAAIHAHSSDNTIIVLFIPFSL